MDTANRQDLASFEKGTTSNLKVVVPSKDIWPGRHKVKFDPFLHAGDLFDEEEMLEWVTDPNVMEVSDQIERVNKKMMEKLLKRNEFLAVFFCKLTLLLI